MPDPILSELDSTTLQELWDRNLQDNFFNNAPTLAYLRHSNSFVPFSGGAFLQAPFSFAGTIGGFFSQGASLNVSKPQLVGSLRPGMEVILNGKNLGTARALSRALPTT